MSAWARVWRTGTTWAVHARHDGTGAWINHYGFESEMAAVVEGDALISQLNAEAQTRAEGRVSP